jgi:PAS domain S-box-containing protein
MGLVVVAEDNAEHRRLIAEVVHRLRHQVVLVSDGKAALAAIAARRPDLVIADVDMPLLDGVQLCRAIRQDPKLAPTRVVLVTAYLPASDPEHATAGATAVVRKPFGVQELSDVVKRCLDDVTTTTGEPTEDRRALAPTAGFVDALLHSLDVGVAVCDPRGRLLLLNQTLRAFFGDDSATVPISDWPRRFVLRHHDGTPLSVEQLPLARALAGESVEHADMLAYDLQGRPRWLVVNAHAIYDVDGLLTGAVAAVHDVTAEHRAHHYQQCKNDVLEVLARAPEAVTAAAQILRVIGLDLGWPYVRLWLVDPVSDRMLPAAIFTAPDTQPLPIPASFKRGDGLAGLCWQRGEPVWVPDIHAPDSPVLPEIASAAGYRAAGAIPVHSGTEVVGVLTFFSFDRQEPEPALVVLLTGITGHIGAYLDRRRAEDLALQLAASVEEYVALVGHELRTPLTSVATYTELITEAADDTPIGQLRDLLDVVVRNTDRLRALVDRLLDLAALESGHACVEAVPVDLATLVAEAAAAARPAADARRIAVHQDLVPELSVPGDPVRLRQAVDHLLDNAVKYSPEDATVTVSLTGDDDVAELTVSDTGHGVATDEHPHVMRRLYRGSNARHSGIPGSGLGLTLARAIVDLHRGSITVGVQQPSGTTVTVRLPRTRRTAPRGPAWREARGRPG